MSAGLNNIKMIVSPVAGILGLICVFFGGAGLSVVGVVLGIISLVTGIWGYKESSSGAAVFGIVLSAVVIVAGLLVMFIRSAIAGGLTGLLW